MDRYKPSPELAVQLGQAESFLTYKERADKLWEKQGRTDYYSTGFEEFDQYLGGGFATSEEGELIVLVAETGVGKSTFASNLALQMSLKANEKVHYMTLENSPESVYNMLRRVADVEDFGPIARRFTGPKKEMIFGSRPLNAEDLLAHMEQMVKAHGTKLFILDHLNFMFENEEQVKNELARIRVVMRLMSQFCINNNATAIVVSHTNRRSEKGYVTLDRIYGSTAIAAAATKVLALNEGFLGDGSRYIDVQLLKSRHTAYNRKQVCRFDATDPKWECTGITEVPKNDSKL